MMDGGQGGQRQRRGGDTRSAWAANEWLQQGQQQHNKAWTAPSRRRRPGVKEARRKGDWVMLGLLVVVWVGVVTAPLWMD